MPTEHVPKVLVELDRADVERLADLAEMEPTVQPDAERLGLVVFGGPVRSKLGDKLRAALASPQPQVEEEYRVVAKYPHQKAVACCGATLDRNLAESIVRGTLDLREHIERCWLQHRTVTTLQDGTTVISPWVDLQEEGGGR
jgi:hypothetical protein